MRSKKTVIFMSIGFLVGICVLLYPSFSSYWNSKTSSRVIDDYESVIEELKPEDYSDLFQVAQAYNQALYETDFPLTDYKKVAGYLDTLKVAGTSVMGYLQIDRINLELPIFHTTQDKVLNSGVGHLEGSSLPIGGESTHSILSAHRGLPSAKLFTDLDRLELGDTFTITIFNEVFTYQVDHIKVIQPNEIDDLVIVDGKDYCTLLTCTPYGINTHRLLVRGIRIETIEEKPKIYVANEAFRIEPLLVTPAVATPMLIIFLIHLMVKYKEPPKKKEEQMKK